VMDATENKIDKAIDIFSCEWSLMKVIGEDSPLFHQLNMVNLGFMSIPEDINGDVDSKLAQQSRRKR